MNDFRINLKRRQIEDDIVARFHKVDFSKRDDAWLEDKPFWDFVFSWHELAHYYEHHADTGIGAHMLELYTQCVQRFRQAASNPTLRERRRDKAADALYQINYHVNQMLLAIDRNTRRDDPPHGSGGMPIPSMS